jgi:DNA-binding transcriptional LysR family regulator
MIDIKDMQHLVALAQHRHFAKAAEACKISQPAFSMRIRNLEEKLGVAIVRRGNRFLGFTEQGDILVRRSRGILDDTKALEQEVNAVSGVVSGSVTMGVVPTALAFAAQLCIRLHKAHPGIVVKIVSTTSLRIQQRMDDGTIDAGITYDDSVSADLMRVDRLYLEEYVLLAPRGMVAEGMASISWADAAKLPMSLLEPQMQNRRILDRMFTEASVQPNVIAESNGFVSSLIIAREGVAATIVPKVLLAGLGTPEGTVAVDLEGANPDKAMCLVTPARRTTLPAVAVMRSLATSSDN